jgi:signal peptide peptidase SppA
MTMGSNDHIEVPDPTGREPNADAVWVVGADNPATHVTAMGKPPSVDISTGQSMPMQPAKPCRNIIGAVMSDVWAIQQQKLDMMMDVLNARQEGRLPVLADIEAASRRERPETIVRGSIAVMPLFGIMAQRMNMVVDFSGGTSTDLFGQAFDAVVADPAIGAIVLEVDSPGGSVYGLEELSKKIFAGRGEKPIIAVANSLMASAAYYVATAADKVYVTPGGQVGSIGTLAIHGESSKADEAAGFKYTIIKAGEFKAEANAYEPLEDEARNEIQRTVNGYYDMFVTAVARHRGVTKTVVQRDYGQGRVLMAKNAKEVGMVDGIATLEQVIDRLARSQRRQSAMREEIDRFATDLPS